MIAIIGDIHGNFYCVKKLIDKILKKYKINKIIFLGDLIDRGDSSKEVINLAMELERDYNLILILGNHEDMMLDYVFNKGNYSDNVWFENGGYNTVKSFSEILYNNVYFGWEDIRDELKIICEKELDFIKKAKLYYVEKIKNTNFFFSHGGIEFFDISPYKQPEKDSYIWAREVDNFSEKLDNFIFVHGHTPVFFLNKGIEGEPFINKNENGEIISINIDTGCTYGGPLTAMILDNINGEFEFLMEKWR